MITDASQLTPRQRDVLEGIIAGESTSAIARRYGISYHTVRAHRAMLYARLGVHNAIQAAVAGYEMLRDEPQ